MTSDLQGLGQPPAAAPSTNLIGKGGKTQPKPLTSTPATTFADTTTNQVVLVTQNGTGLGLLATAPSNTGLEGVTSGTGTTTFAGVYGLSNGATGAGKGVIGQSNSTTGVGVYALETATTGVSYGLLGTAKSTSGVGIQGQATATTGNTIGLFGLNFSTSGIGLSGQNNATTGATIGVQAKVFSASGTAMVVDNTAGGKIASLRNNGVEKFSVGGSGNVAVSGILSAYQLNTSLGVTATGPLQGSNLRTPNNGAAFGLSALNSLTSGSWDTAVGTEALLRNTTGSYNSAFGWGSLDLSDTGDGNTAVGACALNYTHQTNTATQTCNLSLNPGAGGGNTGIGANAGELNGTGNHNTFLGFEADTDGLTSLVNATAIGANAEVGESNALVLGSINGKNFATASVNVGIGTATPSSPLHVVSPLGGGVIFTQATGSGGIGIVAEADSPATDAGDFIGNVTVHGNLGVDGFISAGTKDFKIDDPIDPTGKFLYHASVESSEMMNLYSGVVRLDAKGQGWVKLPEWFEALNAEFRYQLTPIGRSQPGLYIAREISHNRFKIAGGTPHGKVSWQVTGIRHDAYANAHRIKVEEEKTEAEQGTYLHPDVYAQSGSKGIASSDFDRHRPASKTAPETDSDSVDGGDQE